MSVSALHLCGKIPTFSKFTGGTLNKILKILVNPLTLRELIRIPRRKKGYSGVS